MNGLLTDPRVPINVPQEGRFDPALTGALECGWRAVVSVAEKPPAPRAGRVRAGSRATGDLVDVGRQAPHVSAGGLSTAHDTAGGSGGPAVRRRLPGNAGVTLMELLISVMLLSLLSVGMLFALAHRAEYLLEGAGQADGQSPGGGGAAHSGAGTGGAGAGGGDVRGAGRRRGQDAVLSRRAAGDALRFDVLAAGRVARAAADSGDFRDSGGGWRRSAAGGERDSVPGAAIGGCRFVWGMAGFCRCRPRPIRSCWRTSWRSAGSRFWISRRM